VLMPRKAFSKFAKVDPFQVSCGHHKRASGMDLGG
jgi:hypothetical protein